MAIQTAVTIEPASPANTGTAEIITGTAVGDKGRQVTIKITANDGYEFERFDIVEETVRDFTIVGKYSPNNVSAACGLTTITTTLWFEPGVPGYYTTQTGSTLAPNGYYGFGQSQYFILQDGSLSGPFNCPQIPAITPRTTQQVTPTPTPITEGGTGGGGELGLGGGTGVPQL